MMMALRFFDFIAGFSKSISKFSKSIPYNGFHSLIIEVGLPILYLK